VIGRTGRIDLHHPSVRRRACPGAVFHPAGRAADIEMRGVRKVEGGAGDVSPITTVDLPSRGRKLLQ
jgi:hypothetical protein